MLMAEENNFLGFYKFEEGRRKEKLLEAVKSIDSFGMISFILDRMRRIGKLKGLSQETNASVNIHQSTALFKGWVHPAYNFNFLKGTLCNLPKTVDIVYV